MNPAGALGFDPGGGGTGVLAPRGPRARDRERPAHGGAPPPPTDEGDSGDGGDDDGRGDDPEPPPPPDERPPGTGWLGIALAMIGISLLFLIVVAIWLLLRGKTPPTEPDIAPPNALWLSTLVLAASSTTLASAARLSRRREPARHRTVLVWLAWSLVLGVAFLAAQAFLWAQLVSSGFVPASGGYAAIFYASTGLHALHAAGGLVVMAAIFLRLRRDAHLLARADPVGPCAAYWHFMGVLWLTLFTVLSSFR